MAKRFIDTDLFRKPFMRSLEAPYKALWIYLLCECDHAGIWVVELDVAQIRMGMKLDPAKAIEKMGGAVIPIDEGRKWFLPDFVTFQYGTLNPANRVHASVLERLSASGVDPENKPLPSPLQGAKDKEKEKDTQKVKERATPFDTWWTLYAKGSRKLSAEVWDKMPEADRQACIEKTPAYITSKPDPLFRKDGERFLKHRTWEDPIVDATKPSGPPKPMTQQQAKIRLDEIRASKGIPPGGFIEAHHIPVDVREALNRP